MSEVTIDAGPDDTPTVVPLGAQSASVVSTDGQVVIGGLDATGVDEGYVPTADGADGWAWAEQSGGETQDTGWVAYDTAILAAGADAAPGASVRLRRVNEHVYLDVGYLYTKASGGRSAQILAIPTGFRPAVLHGQALYSSESAHLGRWLNVATNGSAYAAAGVTEAKWAAYTELVFGAAWVTADPWPTP